MTEALNLEAFVQLATEDRRRLAVRVGEKLGADWVADAVPAEGDSLAFTYTPLGIQFALIPGGRFDMGIGEADLLEARSYVEWCERAERVAASYQVCASPVHSVRVSPFLCSLKAFEGEALEKMSGRTLVEWGREVPEVRDAIRAIGFRLPSEAELEWLAREGGAYHSILNMGPNYKSLRWAVEEAPHRFGMKGMVLAQWADDAWHPNYEGAPASSEPWLDGDPVGVVRGGAYVEMNTSSVGLLDGLAGRRHSGADIGIDPFLTMRLALDAPML